MTPRERFHAVLGGTLPDRFPLRLIYVTNDQIRQIWPQEPPSNPIDVLRWRHDRYVTHGSIDGGFLRKTFYNDENESRISCETAAQIHCRKNPVPSVHYENLPIQKKTDLKKFKVPDIDDPLRYENVIQTINQHHQAGCFVAVHVLGSFQGTNLLMRPFTDFLMDFYEDPDFIKELLEIYTNFLIDDVCRRLEFGADAVYVCDDLGMNDQMFIPPQMYRDIIKPLHARQVKRFKEFPNVKVILHCDGCVSDIMTDLIEVGFDEINPVDSSDNMRIERLKPVYGSKITLSGGFDRHLGQMNQDELLAHVENVIGIGKLGGRYVATFPVYPELAPQNVIQAVRLIEKQSHYD